MLGYCIVCNKRLRKIGLDRSNGAFHADWQTRRTHKACYQIYCAERVNKELQRLASKFYTRGVEVDFVDHN